MRHGNPTAKNLRELASIFPNGQFQLLRQGIDDSGANAMQSTSSLIDSLCEFSPRMGHGENNCSGREVLTPVEHPIQGGTPGLVPPRHPPSATTPPPHLLTPTRYPL